MSEIQFRSVVELISAQPATDGDGVKLLRVFGGANPARFDPFLLMDEFGSAEASDYVGGFPSHPHRGFETITYMLKGRMEHRDHLDNVGLLQAGDVQWMKAGSGVIHSEMPLQDHGRMRGFQLWLNLPAAEKMTKAEYQDISKSQIPTYDLDGIKLTAIAGEFRIGSVDIKGFVNGKSTLPGYLDIQLPEGDSQLILPMSEELNAMIYVYEGELRCGSDNTIVRSQQCARLGRNGAIVIRSQGPASLLMICGKPIGEPIVQYGPFVMNNRTEIDQAIHDFQSGKLTA